MAEPKRVAVVGAGAAGLATARQLSRAGLEPVVFEAEPEIGGTWVYTEDVEADPLGRDPDRQRIHTSMFADLRTNLPRDLMAFREFPFDGRGGGTDGGLRFPPHQDVLAYLRRFAEHFQLREHLRLDTTVENVQPLDEDGAPWSDHGQEPSAWRVTHRGRDGDSTDELFAAVAVCNGHYAFPRVPALPGAGGFEAACLHSHSYRHPETFAGQRVVLLGARASGVDIAIELGAHAREVHLCARGVKADQPFFGRKNIFLRPPIEHLSAPARAVLTNGENIENVDTLLFCTGYDYRFPFLEAAGTGTRPVELGDNWVYPLYLDLIAARASTLAFVGLGNRIVPFPQYELQATLFARSLAGEISIPNRTARERAAADRATQLRTAGVAERHFLQQGDEQFAYNREIARLAGVPPLPDRFEQVYRAVEEARFRDPSDYRDEELPWFDRESEKRSLVSVRHPSREDPRTIPGRRGLGAARSARAVRHDMPPSPQATQIRIATASDSQDLLDLILRFRDHLRTTEPDAKSLERYLPVALADETVEFYLVWLGDGPCIGYAQARFYNSIWSTGIECTLEDLFVRQEARGRGAGARLLDFVIDRARARNACVIQLYTNDKNLEAQALYRRHGFTPESHAVFVDGREVRWGLQIR